MHAEIIAAVQALANKYVKRVWWADADDLRQTGLVAALEAQRTWDASRGTPLVVYAKRAAAVAMWRYVWRNGSPVSASDHNLRNLRGLIRESVEAASEAPTQEAPTDERLHYARWVASVVAEVAAAIAVDREANLALGVLLEERKPRGLAADTGIPVQTIYRATQRVKRQLSTNAALDRLWKER